MLSLLLLESLFNYRVYLHSILPTAPISFRDKSPPAIMEDVINSVKHLASNADEAGRKKIIDGLRELSYSIETPDDTVQRLMYMVRSSSTVT